MAETEPNIDNVVYLDEYPHLEKKLRLRRDMGQLAMRFDDPNQLLLFPPAPDTPPTPDPAA